MYPPHCDCPENVKLSDSVKYYKRGWTVDMSHVKLFEVEKVRKAKTAKPSTTTKTSKTSTTKKTVTKTTNKKVTQVIHVQKTDVSTMRK